MVRWVILIGIAPGSDQMCFHCNQVGYKKADCPMLQGGVASAPALVTLRITDSCEGREGAPTARIRALQCQFGEAKVSSSAITGMQSFLSS